MKTRDWRSWDGQEGGLTYWCQGCESPHSIRTYGPGAWGWNGDRERPVLTPSVLLTIDFKDRRHVCHSFVGCNGAQPGEVIFLSDCTHAYAGKVLPLPDLPDHVQ